MLTQWVHAFSRMAEARPSVQSLTLTPGQVVMGEVVKQVDDREVIVRIANQLLRAVTEVPLATQKHHWFQVQSNPYHLVLKVVTDRRPSKQGQPVLPTAAALLQNWEIKATRQHLQATQWLMQQDLPLLRQTVEQVATVWQNLGHSAESEQAVMVALSKRLPLNTSIVSAIQQFLTGPGLSRQLTELASQLKQWLKTAESLNAQTKTQVDAVLKQIEDLLNHQPQSKSGNPPASSLAASSSHRTGYVPGSAETVRVNNELTNNIPRQEFLQQAAKSVKREAPITAAFMRKWLQVLGVNYEGALSRLIRTTAEMRSNVSLEQVKASTASVKESLLHLLKFSLPSQVRHTVEAVLQTITGQQLLLSTTNETNWQYLLLQIPFHITGEQEASIHVFTRKNPDGELDTDNCRLLLQLELERLGHNSLLVHIVNRAVHIEWYTNDFRLANELNTYESELREQLQMIGYHLSGVAVKPLLQQAEKRGLAMWPLTVAGSKGVDIRI